MAKDAVLGGGCGSELTNLYTDRKCPQCNRRLRVIGNVRKVQLRLACPDCDYKTPVLSLEEVRAALD